MLVINEDKGLIVGIAKAKDIKKLGLIKASIMEGE